MFFMEVHFQLSKQHEIFGRQPIPPFCEDRAKNAEKARFEGMDIRDTSDIAGLGARDSSISELGKDT
jgi:hypothetical protein